MHHGSSDAIDDDHFLFLTNYFLIASQATKIFKIVHLLH